MIRLSFGKPSFGLFSIGGSLLMMAISSPVLAEDRPVNAAGYPTISLAEAGMSQMPEHADSSTQTSPACARSVRRAGQTVRTDAASQQVRCQEARGQQVASSQTR